MIVIEYNDFQIYNIKKCEIKDKHQIGNITKLWSLQIKYKVECTIIEDILV